jgi:sialidase-1
LAVGVVLLASASASGQILAVSQPLVAGQDGYAVYRIPGFAVANDGSLLLFAEGRPSGSDPGGAGDIDLVAKRSTDGGQTWSSLSVLHASNGFDFSDPRVVVDRISGTAHLQYTQWPTLCGQACVPVGLGNDSSVIYHQTSADHGVSWSGPANINSQVKEPTWASLNTGPGLGIQLQWQDAAPQRNGRLLIPGHRRPPAYEGVSLYSDDGGLTWAHGSGATPGYADESEVIELTNGDLLWDARRGGAGRNQFISHDGGDTWVAPRTSDLPISAVDSGLVRYSARRAGDDRDRILYSAPLGDPPGAGNGRTNIGIWTSYDEGQSFVNPVQIQSGSAAYSVIDKLANGTVGLVYEVSHNTIRYVNVALAELEKAAHPASMSHYDGFGNSIDAFRGGVGWSGSWDHTQVTTAEGLLEFPGFLTQDDDQHALLEGGSMTRSLGLGAMDLNQNQDYYFSLFVNHDNRDANDSASGESLEVQLLDGGSRRFAFGVESDEAFFVRNANQGSSVSSAPDVLRTDTNYLLLAKIAARDNNAPGNADQLMLAWYDSPDDVPAEESQIQWQLAGSTSDNFSGDIDQISIGGGANADWRVDGLRIGTSFSAVIVDTGIAPPVVLGDLDGNLRIELADWRVFKANFMLDTTALNLEDRLRSGDFDQSGRVNAADFIEFQRLYDAAHGSGSLHTAVLQVPEPGAWPLLTAAGVCGLAARSTPRICD